MNFYAAGEAARRKEEILRIVRETTVHSQDEILSALRKRGFKVTQPTLSRDLRDLGLAKTPSGYIVPGEVAPVVTFTPREVRETHLEHLVRDSVLSAEAAVNLVVIKTPTAAAQPVASAIDSADIEDALGTVGGDDTIFVAFRTTTAAAAFARRLQQLAGLSPERRRSRA
ncbi:MAG TPA: arginine repressor [Thermoanaerobaculia bacterium]|nr:arginine repressor [Thermoanaerobaculia bacterium]